MEIGRHRGMIANEHINCVKQQQGFNKKMIKSKSFIKHAKII